MTHDMGPIGTTIVRILVIGACVATAVNAALATWLGLGPLFVGICKLTTNETGIVWFAASALCLLTAFVVSQYVAIRTAVTVIAYIDGIIRTRRISAV